jgi:FlaA1/EpsC-like NDP-sugar epimerase
MSKQTVLIYGAGDAGKLISNELSKKSSEIKICGFIDDDEKKIGSVINSYPVLGRGDDILDLIDNHSVNRIIIALPSVHSNVINTAALGIIHAYPDINLEILPSVSRYFESPLLTELEEARYAELIDRDETEFDFELLTEHYQDRTVVVTGAGGSIGSKICLMLLRLGVKKLVCIGRGENSMFDLKNQLGAVNHTTEIVYKIADIKHSNSLASIFEGLQNALLVHTAAHKHVPFMEDNMREAVLNNILGTITLLRCARSAGFSSAIFISTDKAVNAQSVMGITKRVCERVTASFNSSTFCTFSVRFGNVLGSRGSVIPHFLQQIGSGGPLTVTHPEVKRYFMTISEAAMLVLNSSLFASGGELFLLDMGRQYRITDLARRLMELTGNHDIEIEYTGLRPGEKLTEELSHSYEVCERTNHTKILKISKPELSLNPGDLLVLDDLHHHLFEIPTEKLRSTLIKFIHPV